MLLNTYCSIYHPNYTCYLYWAFCFRGPLLHMSSPDTVIQLKLSIKPVNDSVRSLCDKQTVQLKLCLALHWDETRMRYMQAQSLVRTFIRSGTFYVQFALCYFNNGPITTLIHYRSLISPCQTTVYHASTTF